MRDVRGICAGVDQVSTVIVVDGIFGRVRVDGRCELLQVGNVDLIVIGVGDPCMRGAGFGRLGSRWRLMARRL